MATTVSTSVNIADLTYPNGDAFTITNGARLTVTATPANRPGTITCVTSGELYIENTSTTTPLVFSLNVIANDFRFEKNGKMTTRGASITLGTTNGTASQSFSLASAPLDVIPYPSVVQVGGKMVSVIPVAGETVSIPVTEFEGGGYDVGNVVFWDATARTLTFGDNTNGNIPTSGLPVQIANIYITSNVQDATPANRTQFDLNPSGILDCEWTAFSNRIYFAPTGFGGIRLINSGFTGPCTMTSANGGVEINNLQVNPDTETLTVLTAFQLQVIFGPTKINGLRTFIGGIIASASKNIIQKLYNTPEGKFTDISCYIRQGYVTTSGEALAMSTLPGVSEIVNLNTGGHRNEFTNLSNLKINGFGICDNTDGTQRTVANNGMAFVNCSNIDILYLTNSGSSAFRNPLLTADDQCSTINFYQMDYDGASNTGGYALSAGDNVNFYNSILRNQRASTYASDVSTTFLASRSGMYNAKATSTGVINNDPIAYAEYNPLVGDPIYFQTVFSSGTDFAYANLVDRGENPTTGTLVVGPFGPYTGNNVSKYAFVGSGQYDQNGLIELPTTGDSFEVESLFNIRGITGFSGSPRYTYVSAPSSLTDTTTAPGTIDIDFAIANPTGTFGTYQTLSVANLNSALAGLVGYDSTKGFKMKTRFTATTDTPLRSIAQVFVPTTFDSTFLYPDGYVMIEGANSGDTVKAYIYDALDNNPDTNTLIGSIVGSGQLQISAGSYLGEKFYVIRYDSEGVRIMSTRSQPIDVSLGNNGEIPVYAGNEVQLAQSPQLLDLDAYVRNYLDAKVSEISGGTGGSGATPAEIWNYATRTLTSGGGGITLGEIEASTILAKEATVSSRLASASYTAPDNASITAIKSKTDVLVNTDLTGIATTANITSAISDIKGIEDKDLTEVFNNTPTIDSGAVADAVRVELTPELTTVTTNLDKKVSEVSGGGGGFVRNVGLDIQDKKYLKETHEKVMTLANTDITNIETQLNDIDSHIELAKEDVIDTIKASENEVCSDVIRKTKELKDDNVKTRNLVSQKTKKIDENVSKLADRQDLTDKMIESEADEIEEFLDEMYKKEAEGIEKEIEDQYKMEADEIEKELNS